MVNELLKEKLKFLVNKPIESKYINYWTDYKLSKQMIYYLKNRALKMGFTTMAEFIIELELRKGINYDKR